MYNNSFQSSIGMTSYEVLYGIKCRTSGLGHSIEFQYNVPPVDGWTIRESDPDSGRYVKELCDRL